MKDDTSAVKLAKACVVDEIKALNQAKQLREELAEAQQVIARLQQALAAAPKQAEVEARDQRIAWQEASRNNLAGQVAQLTEQLAKAKERASVGEHAIRAARREAEARALHFQTALGEREAAHQQTEEELVAGRTELRAARRSQTALERRVRELERGMAQLQAGQQRDINAAVRDTVAERTQQLEAQVQVEREGREAAEEALARKAEEVGEWVGGWVLPCW